jgi:hypothetical protein
MFKQIQKLVAGAFCALTLAAGAVAPTHAHELASGRAGQIQNLQFKGDPTLARMIASECVGLIHIIAMHHEEETRIDWTVLARDGKQTIVVAEADVDENDAIVAQGEIAKGAFRGAKISARGYLKGDMFLIDLKMSLGDLEVAFTQVLEPLEETGQ